MANDIETTVRELNKLINVDNVIGEPIETEDKILIPVMRMGFGFGAGENLSGRENSRGVAGAGAGLEPVSLVMMPKKGEDAEGVRVLDLTKRTETNKALSEIGLIISDLIKRYTDTGNDYHDESEYIEPEFTTTEDQIEE